MLLLLMALQLLAVGKIAEGPGAGSPLQMLRKGPGDSGSSWVSWREGLGGSLGVTVWACLRADLQGGCESHVRKEGHWGAPRQVTGELQGEVARCPKWRWQW